jgi:hypothetical protein
MLVVINSKSDFELGIPARSTYMQAGTDMSGLHVCAGIAKKKVL